MITYSASHRSGEQNQIWQMDLVNGERELLSELGGGAYWLAWEAR